MLLTNKLCYQPTKIIWRLKYLPLGETERWPPKRFGSRYIIIDYGHDHEDDGGDDYDDDDDGDDGWGDDDDDVHDDDNENYVHDHRHDEEPMSTFARLLYF